jgi:hypothetical protein
MAAQAKYQDQFMARQGVEGIGVGVTVDGKAGAVVIMTANAAVGGLPRTLDGVPVKLMPTGPFSAVLPKKVHAQPGNGNGHGGGGGGGGGGGDQPPSGNAPAAPVLPPAVPPTIAPNPPPKKPHCGKTKKLKKVRGKWRCVKKPKPKARHTKAR